MIRVVQWATGTVGRHAATAVHRHPDLELAGAYVYTAAKAGRDIGDICGIGPIGVRATSEPDEIFALDADCVLYMAQGEANPWRFTAKGWVKHLLAGRKPVRRRIR